MSHTDPVQPPPTRRGFFGWLTWLAATAAALIFLIPFVAYLASAIRKRKDPWVTLKDPLSRFTQQVNQTLLSEPFVNPMGQPWDGMTAKTNVYVRYLGKDENGKYRFQVFAVNCAHLGCPVSWFPQAGLFLCPCHGGVYYGNGDRASGPPPRGLYECRWEADAEKNTLRVQAPHLPTLQDTTEQPA
jgi:Rieske Fe-S protein